MEQSFGTRIIDIKTGNPCICYTWEEFHAILLIAFEKLVRSGYAPTICIGILRGGFYLTDIITRTTWGKNMPILYLALRQYSDSLMGQDKSVLYNAPAPLLIPPDQGRDPADNTLGPRILIIDELIETAGTMNHAKMQIQRHLKYQGFDEFQIRILTCWHKKTSPLEPDYFGIEVAIDESTGKCPWLITPWETLPRMFDKKMGIELNPSSEKR
jgi:hypoxanthine phosphoribosyltransferase